MDSPTHVQHPVDNRPRKRRRVDDDVNGDGGSSSSSSIRTVPAVNVTAIDSVFEPRIEFAELPNVPWITNLMQEIEPDIEFDDDHMNPDGKCLLCSEPTMLTRSIHSTGLWGKVKTELDMFIELPSSRQILNISEAFREFWDGYGYKLVSHSDSDDDDDQEAEEEGRNCGREPSNSTPHYKIPYLTKRVIVRHYYSHVNVLPLQLKLQAATLGRIVTFLGKNIEHGQKMGKWSRELAEMYIKFLNLHLKMVQDAKKG